MTGIVFRKTLFDARKGIVVWGVTMAVLSAVTMIFYPSIANLKEINTLIESLPPVMKAMIGDIEDFTAPEGFLATKMFASTPLILAIYGILAGVAAVAGEEKGGTIDLLMSAPVPRWRMIVEKFAAFVVSVLGVLAIMYVGVIVGALIVPEIETSPLRLLEATANLVPITLAFGSLTFLLSSSLPGRVSVGMVAAIIVVATYTLNLLGEMGSALASVQGLTPFYYYGQRTLLDGMNWGNVVILLAASLVFLALSAATFERRDLAV